MNRKIWTIGAAAGLLAGAVACSSTVNGSAGAPAGAAKEAVAPAVTPAMLEHGRELYAKSCIACHGESGRGDGPAGGVMNPKPRDHTDRAYMSTLTNVEIGRVIQMGGAIKGKPLMPSSPQLRGADLDAVVAYVRSLSKPSSQHKE
jgi:mono/diheme cytochrome c family protein